MSTPSHGLYVMVVGEPEDLYDMAPRLDEHLTHTKSVGAGQSIRTGTDESYWTVRDTQQEGDEAAVMADANAAAEFLRTLPQTKYPGWWIEVYEQVLVDEELGYVDHHNERRVAEGGMTF